MDDHIFQQIWEYGDMDRSDLIAEWASGKYKELKDCPSYDQVALCCEICNLIVLKGISSGLGTITPEEIVEEI